MPIENRKVKVKRKRKMRDGKRRCWYKTGNCEETEMRETRRQEKEVESRSLGNGRHSPTFKASFAECACGGLGRVVRLDGARRSHDEPRRKGGDGCFGLREEPLSLVVASATRFVLGICWW